MIAATSIDMSLCETTLCEGDQLPAMLLPVNGSPTISMPASGYVIAACEPSGVGVLCVGRSKEIAFHVSISPDELRALATHALRAADLLDGGKGLS